MSSGITPEPSEVVSVSGNVEVVNDVGNPLPVSGTVAVSNPTTNPETGLAKDATLGTTNTEIGGLTEAAPATDTASSGLNGRLQRIAQRLTSLIALLPAALGAGGGLKVDGSGTALPVSGSVTANAGTNLNTSALALDATVATTNTEVGGLTEAAPATDTASSGLNGRLQRIAQRLTSIIALLPAALGAGGGLKVDGSGTALPVSGTVTANAGTNLNTSALALDATVGTTNTEVGGLTETAPATDTASSGLNGRLQRIAQRLTSIIALLPTALGAGGGLKVDGSGTALPVTGTITAVTAITNALPAGTNTIGGVTQTIPTTGTTSQVNDQATTIQLLASDATRKGFRIWNDSTSTLYVKYGTTASLTDCTVKIPPDGYLEENTYSGRVDGIWSVDASGAARITALT